MISTLSLSVIDPIQQTLRQDSTFNIQHSTFNIKYSKIITVIRQIFKDINGSYSTSALIHYILMAQDTGQRSNFSIALNKCQTSYDGNIITYISRPHNPSLNVFS